MTPTFEMRLKTLDKEFENADFEALPDNTIVLANNYAILETRTIFDRDKQGVVVVSTEWEEVKIS